MINNVTLVGRMTKDCDLRYTNTGKAVGSFTLACNRQFKTNGQQEADFINCVAWGKTAENLATYQKKGSLIGLTGRIQTRSFDNQEGKRVFITEVVAENIQFLGSKSDNTNNQNSNKNQDDPFKGEGEPYDPGELPF